MQLRTMCSLSLLVMSFNSFSQNYSDSGRISKPNPHAPGVTFKFVGGDSGTLIGTGSGKPALPPYFVRKLNMAVLRYDKQGGRLWLYRPETGEYDSTFFSSGNSGTPTMQQTFLQSDASGDEPTILAAGKAFSIKGTDNQSGNDYSRFEVAGGLSMSVRDGNDNPLAGVTISGGSGFLNLFGHISLGTISSYNSSPIADGEFLIGQNGAFGKVDAATAAAAMLPYFSFPTPTLAEVTASGANTSTALTLGAVTGTTIKGSILQAVRSTNNSLMVDIKEGTAGGGQGSVQVYSSPGSIGTDISGGIITTSNLRASVSSIVSANGNYGTFKSGTTQITASREYYLPNNNGYIPLTLTVNGGAKVYADATGNIPITGLLSNPMTTLGDLLYGGTSGAATRLAGNTSAVPRFLSSAGNGSIAAAPTYYNLFGTQNNWTSAQQFLQGFYLGISGAADPASGQAVIYFDGTNVIIKKNVNGTINTTTL